MNVIKKTIGRVTGSNAAPRDNGPGFHLAWSEIEPGLQQRLGKGAAGAVYLARLKRVGGPCAVKVLSDDGLDDPEAVSDFEKEVDVMRVIPRHPNVVGLLAVCVEKGHLAIVTEYCPGGDLREVIKSAGTAASKVAFTWDFALRAALDVAQGMEFLHGRGVIHRDLKGRNLLVGANGTIKVGDFGLATTKDSASRTRRNGTQVMHNPVGTAAYMAPEILDGDHRGYTKRVDIYAFGMLLWEIAALQYPLREYTNEVALARAIVDRGERPVVPRTWPRDYAALMRECWHADAGRRPAFSDIVRRVSAMRSSWSKADRNATLGLPESIGRHPDDDDTSTSSGSGSSDGESYTSSSSGGSSDSSSDSSRRAAHRRLRDKSSDANFDSAATTSDEPSNKQRRKMGKGPSLSPSPQKKKDRNKNKNKNKNNKGKPAVLIGARGTEVPHGRRRGAKSASPDAPRGGVGALLGGSRSPTGRRRAASGDVRGGNAGSPSNHPGGAARHPHKNKGNAGSNLNNNHHNDHHHHHHHHHHNHHPGGGGNSRPPIPVAAQMSIDLHDGDDSSVATPKINPARRRRSKRSVTTSPSSGSSYSYSYSSSSESGSGSGTGSGSDSRLGAESEYYTDGTPIKQQRKR
jgi:serine/threonine protein kinase